MWTTERENLLEHVDRRLLVGAELVVGALRDRPGSYDDVAAAVCRRCWTR